MCVYHTIYLMKNRTVITPVVPAAAYFREAWQERSLLLTLCWRDIRVRYKQTYFGLAWSLIRPVLTTIIFTLLFNKVAKFHNPSAAPYPLMVFTGMTVWQFFASALSEASNSLSANANIVGKIYFPRIIIPLSAILSCLLDFIISLVLVAVIMLYYQYPPGPHLVYLPFFLLLLLGLSCGASLFLTSLNIEYRDLRFIIPFIIQFGLYATPVAFSTAAIPEAWRPFYMLNPMVGIADGFKWCILNDTVDPAAVAVSVAWTIGLLSLGLWYFKKQENRIVDII